MNKELELIKRGSVDLVTEKELKAKLKKGKPLRVKVGFDPTAPDLHLGHTVLMHKMRQFQELGHHVIFLIGDFTARIGDPSGRSELRPELSESVIKKNTKTYLNQVSKILDMKRTEVRYNSEWLGKMSVLEFADLGRKLTVARMLERDDFKKRFEGERDITLLEFYYPLLQAQDSVVLKADVELGGSDQLFNLLMGRTIQKRSGQEPQVVLTMPLLVGTDGVQKMSKSYGNYIGVTDKPNDMYGKILSISDELMWNYFDLLSHKSTDEIKKLKKEVDGGKTNPKHAKEELAMEIVARFHNEKSAKGAREHFAKVFSKKQTPDEMDEFKFKGPKKLVDALSESKMVVSKSEARRMIKQGAVQVGGKKISDIDAELPTGDKSVVRCGRRRFARIIITD